MQHLAKINVPLYLRNKRAIKNEKKVKKFRQNHQQSLAHKESLEASAIIKTNVLKMVAGNQSDLSAIKKNTVTFSAPKNFSLIENPQETLIALKYFAQKLLARRFRTVYVDLSQVTEYDLGANAILDVLVDEFQIQARRSQRRIRWTGRYPSNPQLRRFVQAMGVIKKLGITHEFPEPNEAEKLVLFDERLKYYAKIVPSKEKDRASQQTQRFSDHIENCLKKVGRSLTQDGKGDLCRYVSEIIGNVEDHAGMLDWSIQGYLDAHTNDMLCEIVIFCFGKTIANTLEDLPSEHYTRKQVQPYLDKHKAGGFFHKSWRLQDLFTLIALQGHVSCKNESDQTTRGNGSVDLIEFFQKIHNECGRSSGGNRVAKMALVSGSTFILFDGKYKMQKNSDGVRIIALNDANDLYQRPDSKYIYQLSDVSFPGTILSIKFPLDSDKMIHTSL